MLRLNFAAVLMSTLVAAVPAYSQDNLVDLARTDPNQFVIEVQQALKDSGRYSGSINGTLNWTTIDAINSACQAADLLYECQLGPLSPEGATAVVQAIGPEPEAAAGSVEAAVPVEDATAADPVAAAEGAEELIEWTYDGRNNLSVTIDGEGPAATAAITGTAGDADWSNIYSGTVEASPGQTWRFVVTGSADLAPGASATVRVLLRDDTKYLGELASGAVMAGEEPTEYVVTGTIPEGAKQVVPYIQLKYPEGTVADDTIDIVGATFAQVP